MAELLKIILILAQVKFYKYLGIILTKTGKFTEARKNLHGKSIKASFGLYEDLKSLSPSIKNILHIFDHTIKPSCENWGVFNITQKRQQQTIYDIFKEWEQEKLNLKFCKYILGVSKHSTNIAVLSEL